MIILRVLMGRGLTKGWTNANATAIRFEAQARSTTLHTSRGDCSEATAEIGLSQLSKSSEAGSRSVVALEGLKG